MDPMLWELLAEGFPDDFIEVLIKLSDFEGGLPESIEVIARIGNIASCRIRRGDIETVRVNKSVASMKAPRTISLDLPYFENRSDLFYEHKDKPGADRRPNVPYTGRGVALGLVDSGIDVTHVNFCHTGGNSRFVAFWDQRAKYDGLNIYGYGTVHYQHDIDRALHSDSPFQELDSHPGEKDFYHIGTHGCHVLDIAAGNGRVGEPGIAPEANLIGVNLTTPKFKDLMDLGDSVSLFHALHFISNAIENQPLVICLCLGTHGDSHTGHSLIEQTIDYLVGSRDNIACVQSCGNYHTRRTHASGFVVQNAPFTLEWLISEQDQTPNEMELWFEAGDEVFISLIAPNGKYLLTDRGLGRTKIESSLGHEIGRFYFRDKEPSTGLKQAVIILTENAQPGKWRVSLQGKHIVNGRFEAWIERDFQNWSSQSRFPYYQANPNITTGSICNGFHTICVGAYDHRDPKERVGSFSSIGPTWDGRSKPDFVCPGVGIPAAKSASPYQRRSAGELTFKTGTSMAAPWAAGAVCLLYEASDKPLSIQEVKAMLNKACRPPKIVDPEGKKRYGAGILDIELLLAEFTDSQYDYFNMTLRKKNMHRYNLNPSSSPIEMLLETCQEQYPELMPNSLSRFFEALPIEEVFVNNTSIQRGDLIIRRQHAHHQPAWWGVVDYLHGNEVFVLTPSGRKKVTLSKDRRRMDWELRIIKPEYHSTIHYPSIKVPAQEFSHNLLSEQNQPVANPDIRFVASTDCRLRHGPPDFRELSPRQIIPRTDLVEVVQTGTSQGRTYVLVNEVLPPGCNCTPNQLGWTLESNLRSNDASALNWQHLKQQMVSIANIEFDFWNPRDPATGTIRSRDELQWITFDRQRSYWRSVGVSPTDAQLGSIDWQNGPLGTDGQRRNGHAWSGAFISWVVQQAGAGMHFFYEGYHSCYIEWSRKNRKAEYLNNPFWAYAITDQEAAWPEPGDIFCKNRNGPFTIDTIRCGNPSHCDIVVEVDRQNLQLVTIGGNIGNRVDRTTVRLTANGFVDASHGNQNTYFALIKVRTVNALQPAQTSQSHSQEESSEENHLLDESTTSPLTWCQIKGFMVMLANTEELIFWKNPYTGNNFKENDSAVFSLLEKYWRAVRGGEPNPPVHRNVTPAVQAARSANDEEAWSAAFISWVLRASHVREHDGFEFSRRHITYIVQSLANRELSNKTKPFWLYGKDEIIDAPIESGDILCFNRRNEDGNWTSHSYSNLRSNHWNDINKTLNKQLENVKGSSHCNIVVDTFERGNKKYIVTIGGNESNTLKRVEWELDAVGSVKDTSNLRFFGMIKLVECPGSPFTDKQQDKTPEGEVAEQTSGENALWHEIQFNNHISRPVHEYDPLMSFSQDYSIYQPPFAYNHVPGSDYKYKCDPVAIPKATLFPAFSNYPDSRIEQELFARGLKLNEIATFKKNKGFDSLNPIAKYFGAAFGELLNRIRYSKEWIIKPPNDSNEHKGFTAQQLLGARLLLTIPDHFRELARLTTDSGEAFALECLGWLMMYKIRDEIKTATTYEWWLPPMPDFVTYFPSSIKERKFGDTRNLTLGATYMDTPPLILSKQVFDLIKLHGFENLSLSAMDFQYYSSFWVAGLAGQFWMAETGQLSLPPGRPFYVSLLKDVPTPCFEPTDEKPFKDAWAKRVDDVNEKYPKLDITDTNYKERLKERINFLNSGITPGSVNNLIMPAFLGKIRLAYYFPALNQTSQSHQSARPRDKEMVHMKIKDLVEKIFKTIEELGWNDLTFQSQGSFLFRGIGGKLSGDVSNMSVETLEKKEREALKISNHAYGSAIDLNPYENPRTNANVPAPMHPRIVALMEAFGFTWGYCFTNQKDRHHFEYKIKCPTVTSSSPVSGIGEGYEEVAPASYYGGYDLQFGDKDSESIFGGNKPGSTNEKFVENLQMDLITLGFKLAGTPDGDFGFKTESAVREFQIYAKMPNVAIRLRGPLPQNGDELDLMQSTANTRKYQGEINGVANSETRNLIEYWKTNDWHCPVIIQAREKTTFQIHNSFNNLWGYRELVDKSPWVYVRDYSGYFPVPTNRLLANQSILLGRFSRYEFDSGLGGPTTEEIAFNWHEAEITTENLVGTPSGSTAGNTKSTFNVIRAVSQVECQGYLDHINAYDNAFVSLGPFHWVLSIFSARSKKITSGGELPAFFAFVKVKDSAVFDKAIGFFGAGVEKEWAGNGDNFFIKNPIRNYGKGFMTLKRGNGTISNRQGSDDLNIENYFRNWHWIYRFAMAFRTIPGLKRCVWDFARLRIRDVLNINLINFGFVDAQGNNISPTLGTVFTSERAIAMIIRIHVRYPSYIAGVNKNTNNTLRKILLESIDQIKKEGLEHKRLDQFGDRHEEIMVSQILNTSATLGGDLNKSVPIVHDFPGDLRLSYPISLSNSRGSFQFDSSGLGNPPSY
jgi:peptidoglycan hydrolase-like protein with peptidoglycan-binding domain